MELGIKGGGLLPGRCFATIALPRPQDKTPVALPLSSWKPSRLDRYEDGNAAVGLCSDSHRVILRTRFLGLLFAAANYWQPGIFSLPPHPGDLSSEERRRLLAIVGHGHMHLAENCRLQEAELKAQTQPGFAYLVISRDNRMT